MCGATLTVANSFQGTLWALRHQEQECRLVDRTKLNFPAGQKTCRSSDESARAIASVTRASFSPPSTEQQAFLFAEASR
jgi:hypothetical protein